MVTIAERSPLWRLFFHNWVRHLCELDYYFRVFGVVLFWGKLSSFLTPKNVFLLLLSYSLQLLSNSYNYSLIMFYFLSKLWILLLITILFILGNITTFYPDYFYLINLHHTTLLRFDRVQVVLLYSVTLSLKQ